MPERPFGTWLPMGVMTIWKAALSFPLRKDKMYPIEVKSGTRYTTDSLLKFREKYKTRIGGCYIIHPRNLIVNDDILCIPPYMTICL